MKRIAAILFALAVTVSFATAEGRKTSSPTET
jgi:hypothetical protein